MRFPALATMKCFQLGHNELEALADLEALCFTLPWNREQLATHLTLPNFTAFGLRAPPPNSATTAGGTLLVAYISCYHNPDELEILNLAVAPEWRGRGCATRLLRLVLRVAAQAGLGRAVLEVRSGNLPALALYARQGFTQVGLRRAYYRDSGEDALVLEHVLRAP